jgi:hypothetical protein
LKKRKKLSADCEKNQVKVEVKVEEKQDFLNLASASTLT